MKGCDSMGKNNFRKGEYEEAVECAKNLLEEGAGMNEIMSKTQLDEEQIRKVKIKREEKLNDD